MRFYKNNNYGELYKMEKLIFLIIAVFVLFYPGCKKNDSNPSQILPVTELEGAWNGHESGGSSSAWVFIFNGNNYDGSNINVGFTTKGTFSLNTATDPKQIDFQTVSSSDPLNIGKVYSGIYIN